MKTSPRWVFLFIVTAALLLIGSGSFLFGRYAGTRVIQSGTERLALRAGELHTIRFRTSSTLPAVKIEICPDTGSLQAAPCLTLADKVKGSAVTVYLPISYPAGKAVIKVTNYDKKMHLSTRLQYKQSILVVSPFGKLNFSPTVSPPVEIVPPAETPAASPDFDPSTFYNPSEGF
jgi:hypothetical protein